MPILLAIHVRPPLAVARLGKSVTPLENYVWRDDPTIHGGGRTVIEPATTLLVTADGSVRAYRPESIQFRDDGALRPVAPFFELWADIEYTAGDAAEPQPSGGTPPQAGSRATVALTSTLLSKAGGRLDGVSYRVDAANAKAARRTGDPSNAFGASITVKGNDWRRHPLLGFTRPVPGAEPLVSPEAPIPLGSFQVIRPQPRAHQDVDLDVLRVRLTPAKGEVYGPPTAIDAADANTGKVFQIVPPQNRILNPKASWLRYDGSYSKYVNPEPWDTYDGADQDANVSWGVVDDTCDGVLTASVVVRGRRFSAEARFTCGPPDFAPDRRPFLSLADDLADRDEDPLSVEELLASLKETQGEVADLFQRVFETASLINLDAIRGRALGDNAGTLPNQGKDRVGDLPLTDQGSMTGKDTPYADAKIQALTRSQSVDREAETTRDPLPYSAVVPLAHERLSQTDELLSLLEADAARARRMLRPAYGAFAELEASVAGDAVPNPDFRDPRILRDQAHDMRMPPYMRDELSTALSLTRRQYLELIRYIDVLDGQAAYLRKRAGAADTSVPAAPDSPLRRRVQTALERIRGARRRGGAPE